MDDGKDDAMCLQVNPIDGTIKVEMPQKDQLESPAKVSTHPTIYVTFPVEIVKYYCGWGEYGSDNYDDVLIKQKWWCYTKI